ncbi:hypothetical protein ABVK25_008121 [Lepraria finkii]|uniref:Uncharacterized protein n=1 Tax=Lepraria finkii TaxID=1340010 RepID=A0ABR4B356_9LECA
MSYRPSLLIPQLCQQDQKNPVKVRINRTDPAEDTSDVQRNGLLWGRGLAVTQGSSKSTGLATEDDKPLSSFIGLNALEIAAVLDAKQFLSQRVVQKVVDDIWNGRIMFWESLSVHSKKKAKIYNKGRADPYCRLRVPKYQNVVEDFLYVWIAAFAYDELGEFQDAGSSFYGTDFWSLWDLGIIGIGFAYMISSDSPKYNLPLQRSRPSVEERVIGLAKNDADITDVAFDILSLEAIFLLPRVCALLSLIPFFATPILCLKEMTKDSVKYLGIVIILFCAFLATFTMLAQGEFTANEMLWTMINIFFG